MSQTVIMIIVNVFSASHTSCAASHRLAAVVPIRQTAELKEQFTFTWKSGTGKEEQAECRQEVGKGRQRVSEGGPTEVPAGRRERRDLK